MGAQKVDHPVEVAHKTIAIIQVTRIGDILQTIHSARLLKINHPDYKIILIARKQFLEPVAFIANQVFDEIVTLDFKKAISLTGGLAGSKKAILNQLDILKRYSIDASINLSFSKSSSYIHSLIKSKHKLGPYYDLQNQKIIQDKWSQYLYSTVMRGDLNPFNIVDLFSSIIGIEKKSTHLSNVEFSKEVKRNILIHPFASADKKRWVESKWTEVIYKLLKNNPDKTIYIAGGSTDLESFKKITNNSILSEYKSRIVNLIGKNVSELYSMVDDTFLFIGHDSMLGNLLSFKNVKSVTIALGTVRPQETAPYALNNYVLSPKTNCYPCFPDTKCSFFQCHADIPYQVVTEVAQQLLSSNSISTDDLRKTITDFHLNSVDLRKTTSNKIGQLVLKDILNSEKSVKDVFREFYQIIWTYSFSEVDLTLDAPNISKRTRTQLEGILQSVENLYELAEFGKKYSRYILEEISAMSPDINKIKNYSLKIDEIDRLLDVLTEATPLIAPVTEYGKVAKANLYGSNIVELTESAFYVYQEISTTASIIYDFLNSINIKKTKSNPKQGKSL